MMNVVVAVSVLSQLTVWLEHLFAVYGYPIVFLAILGESAGLPLPGETVLLAAGVEAQQHALSLPVVWLIAASAAIVGDNIGYWVGHWGGRPLLVRYGRILRVREKQIRILDRYFEVHGSKTVFFGRWVVFLRVWAALFAGAAHMHWRRFFVFNALGGTAWAVSMSTLAYLFAASVGRVSAAFGVVGWVLAVLVAISVIVFVVREERRSLEKFADQNPEPTSTDDATATSDETPTDRGA
jgi:membrane protein DedA with SNARE-associated domain